MRNGTGLASGIVIDDFERTAMNAFSSKFQSQLHGCQFHFGHCTWRKVQEYGYANLLTTDLIVNRAKELASSISTGFCRHQHIAQTSVRVITKVYLHKVLKRTLCRLEQNETQVYQNPLSR